MGSGVRGGVTGAEKGAERRWIHRLGPWFLHLLFATVRFEHGNRKVVNRLRETGQPVVFVFWHGHILPLLYSHRGEQVATLVSRHRDGTALAGVLERLGYRTVRGSSTRGGAAGLRGLIRAARSGSDLAITPDGPRGPAGVFKPGAIEVARMTGLPLLPVGVGVDRAWRLRSWDGFLIPKPLGRVRIVYGDPIRPDAGEGHDTRGLADHLSDVLNELRLRAEDFS